MLPCNHLNSVQTIQHSSIVFIELYLNDSKHISGCSPSHSDNLLGISGPSGNLPNGTKELEETIRVKLCLLEHTPAICKLAASAAPAAFLQ